MILCIYYIYNIYFKNYLGYLHVNILHNIKNSKIVYHNLEYGILRQLI